MVQQVFEAIGTKWVIDIFEPISPEHKEKVLQRIKARIDEFDRAYSRFRADSLVTAMSKASGVYMLPDDARAMLDLYWELYQRTGGYFTPLIGDTLVQAGYDAVYSLEAKEVGAALSWDEVLEYRFPELVIKKPTMLDFGAAGKGYLIDIVSEMMHTEGIAAFCVDAGGDMFYAHPTNMLLDVALENPKDATQAIGVAHLANESICGSAGNRRVWQDFHHIMNPKTAESSTGIAAIWTVADTTLLADALSTCLFFVPAVRLAEYDFEYLILKDDFSIEKSLHFPATFFT